MVWNFIQNQILGMNWLNFLTGKMLVLFGLNLENRFAKSVQFFV